MREAYDAARERLDEELTQIEFDVAFDEGWASDPEHIAWLLSAPIAEIKSWAAYSIEA